MNQIQKIALIYLLALSFLMYGYSVGRLKVFPYEFIEGFVKDYQAFAAGDPLEKKTSVAEKIKSDLGLSFDRFLYNYPRHAGNKTKATDHPTLKERKEPPRVFIHPEHRSGYRVIIGAFNLSESFWGGLLLNSTGEIIHTWQLSTDHLPTNKAADNLKNLYGVHVFPDGSVIFSMHESGGGIVKVDACSKIVWGLKGEYHHAISPDENKNIWSFVGKTAAFDQDMVRVSVITGEVNKIIKMTDVREANPDIHIWDLQTKAWGKNFKRQRAKGNMTHGNDIEPLPAHLSDAFPMFNPGDLIISYATTNLIFVLDPKTLKIKWWRVGISSYQHDPDWEPNGEIAIFNNNLRVKKYGNIVSINPVTYKSKILLDGKPPLNFTPGINGRHQLTPFGTRMVTSAQQGWAFEMDENGKIVFSFLNNTNFEEKKSLHLSEAWRFNNDYFERPFWEDCNQL